MDTALKFNSIKVGSKNVTLTFMSENAEQSVPVVVSAEDDITPILTELEKLRLIVLNVEGFAPHAYLASLGYQMFDDNDREFSHDKLVALSQNFNGKIKSLMDDWQNRMTITDFALVQNGLLAKIKFQRFFNMASLKNESDIDAIFTPSRKCDKTTFAPIDIYGGLPNKGNFSEFGAEILEIFNRIAELAQPFFMKYFKSLTHDAKEIKALTDENQLELFNDVEITENGNSIEVKTGMSITDFTKRLKTITN